MDQASLTLPEGKIGFWLIDVDGPLNPYSGTNKPRIEAGYKLRKISTINLDGNSVTYRLWLNPEHGTKIWETAEAARLEPVWCTTWEHRANGPIAHAIGLKKRLPVIEFGRAILGPLWKVAGILDAIPKDVPVIWSDDDFRLHTDAVSSLLGLRSSVTYAHVVSPRTGFTSEDFEFVKAWSTALEGA